MIGLALRAIRRRWLQAALLFLLATAAATGAAAAPGYIAASAQEQAVSAIASAPPRERVVAVSRSLPLEAGQEAGQVAAALATVRDTLTLPGFGSVEDVRMAGQLGDTTTVLAARSGMCEQLVLEGTCPGDALETAISGALADRLKLRVGDSVEFTSADLAEDRDPPQLRIVGVFVARAPFDPYWGRSGGTRQSPVPGERLGEDMLLTQRETFAAIGAERVSVALDLVATPDSFRQTDPQLLALAAERGAVQLAEAEYEVATGLRTIADRIWVDQRLVLFAVPIGAVQLMVLCWFALFLAVRQTAEERQPDVAKLKLHGVRRRDIWALAAGQITLPLLGGGVVGFAVGLGLVQGLGSGAAFSAEVRSQVLLGSLAATALAVVGAIVAALLAERRIMRGSVLALGRRIQDRRGGLRTGIVEVSIFTVAIAAAYQIGRQGSAAAESKGLALAAPLFLALAVALLAARLVPLVANASTASLLRSGRVGAWLIALNLARRPGQFRVLALLSLAVAVFCGAAFTWIVSTQARANRVAAEVGAERVVTVQAESRAALLAAVRELDPQGRYAMAAVHTFGTLPTLAVDLDRLGAVTPWQPGYGVPDWADLTASLRPTGTPEAAFTSSDALRLAVTWRSDPNPVRIVATFATRAGGRTEATFGPLRPGRHEYDGHVSGCSPSAPCRLVAIAVTPKEGSLAVGPGTAVLHTLREADGTEVVATATFADRTRWRNDVTPGAHTPVLSTTTDGLTITDAPPARGDAIRPMAPVYLFDAPMPLPVLTVGETAMAGEVGDPRLAVLGAGLLPVRVVGRAAAMPRLGTGVLVDLEYVDRVLTIRGSTGLSQVWLGPDAPPDVLDRLAAAGLSIVTIDSAADRAAGLAAQGPPVALWFLVLVSAAGVLLALGSFAVWTAAERTGRASELAALRRQGLSQGSARVTALGGYAAFVLAAVGTGVLMALALRRFQPLPVFADDWDLLATPQLRADVAAVAVLPAVVLLLGAALVAGVVLLRATGRRGGSA